MSAKTVKKVVKSKAKGATAKAKPLKPTPIKKIKYKPSEFDNAKIGEIYYYSSLNSNIKSELKVIDGVRFCIIREKKTNCRIALGQCTKSKVLLKECASAPGDIEKRLSELIKEKHNPKYEYSSFYEWGDFISYEHYCRLINYVGCGSSSIKALDKQGAIEDFVATLKKMPTWDKTKFYRGMRFYDKTKHSDFIKGKKVGSLFKIDCITSVSASRKIAERFACMHGGNSYYKILMEIDCKNVKHVASNDYEQEGLLLKGTKFVIKDIKHNVKKKLVNLKLIEK
jgi:hypothetical protein